MSSGNLPSMPKAGHGDGSLRQRGSSWEARVMLEGRTYSKTLRAKDRTTARKLMRSWIVELEKTLPDPAADHATVGDLLTIWLHDRRRKGAKSLPQMESRVGRLQQQPIAKVRATRLTRADVAELGEDLRQGEAGAKPLSPASSNRFLETVRSALNHAQKMDPPIPVRIPHFEMQAEDNVRQGFLRIEDYQRVLESIAEPWLRLLFSIGFHVGARAGAILATRWDQVDWDTLVIRPPASQSANKIVGMWPIYGDLERLLRVAHFQHEAETPDVPWIIHRDGRQLHNHDDYRFPWAHAAQLAGLPDLHIHDLRRTAARNMLAAGVPETEVCKVIGWKGPEMLRRYAIQDELAAARAGRRTAEYLTAEKTYLGKDLGKPPSA